MSLKFPPGIKVDRKTLVDHLRECHPNIDLGAAGTRHTDTLAREHSIAHWKFWCNHHHGENRGPTGRPVGWWTGENAVPLEPTITHKAMEKRRNG